jgi:hypothetical protein
MSIVSRHSRQLSKGSLDISTLQDSTALTSALQFQQVASVLRVPDVWRWPCTWSTRKTYMFRISTIDTQRERRLVVEGTLVSPWVAELRTTWSSAGNSLEGRTLVIDLRNATTIDREGEDAILELMQEGAKFYCSGVLTKHVLKQAAHRCHTSLGNVLNRKRLGTKEE